MAISSSERDLARLLRRRDTGIIERAERKKGRVSDASKAASKLEADRFMSRMDPSGGSTKGDIEGALTAGAARGLEERSANIDRQAIQALEGPGKQLLVDAWQREQMKPIEDKARKKTEAADALSTLAGAFGTMLSAAGTITGLQPLTGAGMLVGGLGSGVGKAIGDTAMTAADKKALSDIGLAGAKAMATPSTYKSMLSSPTSYKGFELRPGGAFGGAKRRRFNLFDEEEDIFGG